MRDEGMTTAMVAIGGIKGNDIKLLRDKGIEGIAVSGAVLDSDDPADDMRMMIREIQNEDNI